MYFVIAVTVVSALVALAYVWIWALLHCRSNQTLSREKMERWLLFIGLTPFVGALAYLYWHRHDPIVLNIHLKH